jgi:hypothetical protein
MKTPAPEGRRYQVLTEMATACAMTDVKGNLVGITLLEAMFDRLDALGYIAAERTVTPAAHWRVKGQDDPHGDRYLCPREDLIGGDFTDDELANSLYLDPISPNLEAGKDRIRWLSRRVAHQELQQAIVASEDELRTPRKGDKVLMPSGVSALGEDTGIVDFTSGPEVGVGWTFKRYDPADDAGEDDLLTHTEYTLYHVWEFSWSETEDAWVFPEGYISRYRG